MIFSRDTDAESEAVLVALLRRKSPGEKLAMIDGCWEILRALHRSGLRQRHPGLADSELERRSFELLLGPDLARRVLAARRDRDARA